MCSVFIHTAMNKDTTHLVCRKKQLYILFETNIVYFYVVTWLNTVQHFPEFIAQIAAVQHGAVRCSGPTCSLLSPVKP